MHIDIDTAVYSGQTRGGISRMFNEILPRMCDIDPTLNINLLVYNNPVQPLPKHSCIRTKNLIPKDNTALQDRLWKFMKQVFSIKSNNYLDSSNYGNIWHSTYYTLPNDKYVAQIVTVHDMIYERFTQVFYGSGSDEFREIKKKCILNADAIICVSETTKTDLLNFYNLPESIVQVIHQGYSNEFKSTSISNNRLRENPFLLYVGSRASYKGVDILFQAYSQWSNNNNVELVVIGEEWSKEEMENLKYLKIYDKVCLLNNIDDKVLAKLYLKALAFIYPSLYEGFGIPLLEAMASGCPIIASRIPSTVEVAGDCPIYFEPARVDDLIRSLNLVIDEGKESDRIRLGFQHVKKYSWDATASQTLKVYRTVNELTK